jgi:ring-1,2-phenylacetyl-CoA epoxidase subunit PaaE
MTTATAAPGRLRGEFFPLAVAEVTPLCADAVAVTFDVPAGLAGRYEFRAGQSLTLRRMVQGRDERRSYSICAPEGAAPRIGVREMPGGLFSAWLAREVRPGDAIEVGVPSGSFTPSRPAPGHHVMIVAGSGITPVLSIAATVLRDEAAAVTLLYGNRHADTVMFADDLADLKDRYPARLDLVHVLSREAREAELLSGRLDAARLTGLLPRLMDPGQVAHWWLCGPLDMITGAQGVLRGLGVPPARVHRELFYAGDVPPPPARHEEAPPTGLTTEVTVTLDGRSTHLVLPRDVPVLEAAQRARPDLPFACKGGVCGTCRARVTAGEVRMRRNYALEESEVRDGFVLTCQSLPLSDALTVDYDS